MHLSFGVVGFLYCFNVGSISSSPFSKWESMECRPYRNQLRPQSYIYKLYGYAWPKIMYCEWYSSVAVRFNVIVTTIFNCVGFFHVEMHFLSGIFKAAAQQWDTFDASLTKNDFLTPGSRQEPGIFDTAAFQNYVRSHTPTIKGISNIPFWANFLKCRYQSYSALYTLRSDVEKMLLSLILDF